MRNLASWPIITQAELPSELQVSPDASGLPGSEQLQNFVNGIAFWGLVAAIGVVIAGGALWAVSSRSQNYGGVGNGKTLVFGGVIGAAIIGAAQAIVGFFYQVGSQVEAGTSLIPPGVALLARLV